MAFQTPNLRIEESGDLATLWLDVPGRPMNVFSQQVMTDLEAAVDFVTVQSSLKVLVIRSAKTASFIAGADLHEFLTVKDAHDAASRSERGQRLFARTADLRVPTIVVIHGPCLGGGLEFALACDYRLVVDHPKTQIGLPEIELGLLPGWGGTQRLPRVVGLEVALKMILSAKRLKATEALRLGLADALAADGDIDENLSALVDRARREGKRPKESLPLRNWKAKFIESNPVGRYLIYRGAEKTLKQRVPDDMPAPYEALKAIGTGLCKGIDAGLAYEREATGRLLMTPACHNLVNLFFQREKARKLPAELRADLGMPVKRVGIIGAGTMGAGIAQLAAVKGFQVVVREVNEKALAAGMERIETLFRKALANRVMGQNTAIVKRGAVRCTTAWEGFDDVDLVIEAAIEDLEAKQAIFRELEQHVRPNTLLATNTSSLLVERLQETCKRPERVGGLHFFNPVHKMPLVEVVRGPASEEPTIAILTRFAIDLGKTPVVVKDSPGFVVNRILMPYLNEAVLILTASRDASATLKLDRAMRRFGMPAGPLEVLDQVGLDVAAHVERSIRPAFGERFLPNPLLARMCERGWLGEKRDCGFYLYGGKGKRPNRGLLPLLGNREDVGSPPCAEDARDRLVLLMVNEAAASLGQGLTASADGIDLAMVFGTGWAPHRGGPLHYADQLGIGHVVKRLDELVQSNGPRFEPCPELRRRAASGEPFFHDLVVPAHA